jgi:hypothetical protein
MPSGIRIPIRKDQQIGFPEGYSGVVNKEFATVVALPKTSGVPIM